MSNWKDPLIKMEVPVSKYVEEGNNTDYDNLELQESKIIHCFTEPPILVLPAKREQTWF
jgi:hypothetical protein